MSRTAVGVPACLVFLAVFVVYNLNGREIGVYDSQPLKFLAIAIAHDHNMTLDSVVNDRPQLAERPGFAVDRTGHYRSAYPPLPGIIGGCVAWLMATLNLLDLDAPLAANVAAKVTASMLAALSAAFVFVVASRRVTRRRALAIALGYGLGTTLWSQASQTLWQSETAVAALAGALVCLAVPRAELTTARVWAGATLLGVAGSTRLQLVPAIAVVAMAMALRRRRVGDLWALSPLVAIGAVTAGLNHSWFGSLVGARARLESFATLAHGVDGPIGNVFVGAAGMLFSPSRGLLVFSPVVLVAVAAWPGIRAARWTDDLRWSSLAAVTVLVSYSFYSAWWGGHSYGPRLLTDMLPFLTIPASAGIGWVLATRWRRVAAAALLAWSMLLAGTGAVVFPHERWNTWPADVDRHHERLWDWRDPQFVRAWRAGPSPDTFSLFAPEARRAPR